MANELEILTENAAGTSWVDLIPSAVSTGYQAQNTNIEANRNGIDASYVRYDSGTDEIVIDPSGPIDVNGLPFSVKSEIRLANPGAGTWHLKVVAGSDDTLKSIETTSSMGAWVASKNALYDTGERVLNWNIVINSVNVNVSKLLPINISSKINIADGQNIDTKNIYLLPTALYTNSFDSPSLIPTGLAFDESAGNLISCDDNTNRIYVHSGVTSTISTNFASPGSSIKGITIDSSTGNLISCDDGTDLIYVHSGISSTILTSFASPAVNPTDLTYDSINGNLIISTSANIYIQDGVSVTNLSSFASPAGNTQGLAFNESTGNLISAGLSFVYIHDKISSSIINNFVVNNSVFQALTYNTLTKQLINTDANPTASINVHKTDIVYIQ